MKLRALPILLAAGSALAGSGMAAGAWAQTAAMYRGDPAHTGHYATRAVSSLGGLQWRFATGGPVRSTPAVHAGVVYVGSDDGGLYAIDRQTGEPRWRYDAGSPVSSSPAVSGDVIVVGSADGVFHGVRRTDGARVWRLPTGETRPLPWGHESADMWTASPVVDGGTAVFGAGDGRVYAVDAATGTVRWSTATGGRIRSAPALYGGTAVVGATDGVVYVLSLEDGRILRRHATEGASLLSAAYGFDRRSIQSSPAVVGDRIYIGAKDGFLYALEHATADRAWRADHRVSWVIGGPAVADGVVYTGTSDGRFLQALDATSGREVWRTSTPLAVWTSPSVAGDVVYAGDNSGTAIALDRRDGGVLWTYRTGGAVLSSPVPDDGMVFVGSDDGGVYALREGPAVQRAVFWDSTLVRATWYRGHEALRDYLAARGYTVLDGAGLAAFLAERTRDGAPSVVVLTMDHLPEALGADGAEAPLRRYLDAGGKAVGVNMPPLLWPRDSASGSPGDLLAVKRDAPRALLDVGFQGGNFDAHGAWPTGEGRRWGLDGWWLARWAADPGAGVTVLARDGQGNAAAWVKSYGGPPGTGFVRVWGNHVAMPDPGIVHRVAEYRPTP